MSAAPVEDTQSSMHDRGTSQEVNQHTQATPAPSTKGDAATQVSDSKDAGSGTTGRGNQADSETVKDPAGADKVPGDDDATDEKDKKKKDDVPAEQKVDMSKYAIHSDLKDELDKEIEKKPEKDWGETNPTKIQEMQDKAQADGDGARDGTCFYYGQASDCPLTLDLIHSQGWRPDRPYCYARCWTQGGSRRQSQAHAPQGVIIYTRTRAPASVVHCNNTGSCLGEEYRQQQSSRCYTSSSFDK